MTASNEQLTARLAATARLRAARGKFDGRMTNQGQAYMESCIFDVPRLGLRVIFTRDTGHHTSGWFKNPDYERCLHMSVSPLALVLNSPAPDVDPIESYRDLLLRSFFGVDARLAWCESAKSPEGKAHRVEHWRVFCDESWTPIHPRREVYSRDFTEKGWKSASEIGVQIISPLSP